MRLVVCGGQDTSSACMYVYVGGGEGLMCAVSGGRGVNVCSEWWEEG